MNNKRKKTVIIISLACLLIMSACGNKNGGNKGGKSTKVSQPAKEKKGKDAKNSDNKAGKGVEKEENKKKSDDKKADASNLKGSPTGEPSKEDLEKMMKEKGVVDLSKYDAKKIEDYGEKVDIDGKKMNVYVTGKGTTPLVIFPGQSEISTKYAYKNLVDKLSKNFKLYMVEPFGTGLSDVTDKPRTVENITSEIHQAMDKLGVKNYYIAAHSLGGMYALNYVKEYPNEVKGFIGIDTSTPPMEGDAQTRTDKDSGQLAQTIPEVDDKVNEQYFSIGKKMGNNKNLKDEDESVPETLKKMRDVKFPEGFKAKYFLADETVKDIEERKGFIKELKSWDQQHYDLSKNPKDVSIEVLKGDHLLYHTQYNKIADGINDFVKKVENK